jgi:hypothetical protein
MGERIFGDVDPLVHEESGYRTRCPEEDDRPMATLALAVLVSLHVHASSVPEQALRPGEALEYRPFYPDEWRDRGVSTRLVPWEGEHVVLLTTDSDLDPGVVATFLRRLDAGWKLYRRLIRQAPHLDRHHNGKVTIAAVPRAELLVNAWGLGTIGATGIEVAGFYTGDYELVSRRPDSFPPYYFYEMGRNYATFGDRHSLFYTGYAVFMRYVCMDAAGCVDPDPADREAIEAAEAGLGETDLTFLEAFTSLGRLDEKAPRLEGTQPSDQPVMYASVMLKLRRDHGGDEWVGRFFRFLSECPEVKPETPEMAMGQWLNWLVAASCAARQDLSGLFAERWRMPLDARTRAAMAAVDWTGEQLSAREVLSRLPRHRARRAR